MPNGFDIIRLFQTGDDKIKNFQSGGAEWDKVAPAWEKNHSAIAEGLETCNELVLEQAGITPGIVALDLGSGTGYPALLAAQKVGPTGRVTGVDFSGGMLDVARRKAETLGLGNIEFKECDVTSLPFEDSSFDAVTSRFCLMFLPELAKTLSEVFRVLKPGGRFSTAVWADSDKNPSISTPMKILREYVEMPPPDPLRPGIFSLAEPGVLQKKMRDANFVELVEKEVPVYRMSSSGAECVNSLKEMAAPLKKMFASLTPEQSREAEAKMADAAEKYRKGERVEIPGAALVVSGIKPR